MEREVGGGIGMGNTCKPIAVSFQCMTKSTTIKIIIIILKIKLKRESKKKESYRQHIVGVFVLFLNSFSQSISSDGSLRSIYT